MGKYRFKKVLIKIFIYKRHNDLMTLSSLFSYCSTCLLISEDIALLILLFLQRNLVISSTTPYFPIADNIPAIAGPLSSMEAPWIFEAALIVSSSLLYALRRGRLRLPSSESCVGHFFLAVEVLLEISKAGVLLFWAWGVFSTS